MELWEFNNCVKEYNKMYKEEQDKIIIGSWQTANFANAAFNGKLKPLTNYIKEEKKAEINKDDFEKRLAEVLNGRIKSENNG